MRTNPTTPHGSHTKPDKERLRERERANDRDTHTHNSGYKTPGIYNRDDDCGSGGTGDVGTRDSHLWRVVVVVFGAQTKLQQAATRKLRAYTRNITRAH